MLYQNGYAIRARWFDETPFYDSDGDEVLKIKVHCSAQRHQMLGDLVPTTSDENNANPSNQEAKDAHADDEALSCHEVVDQTGCKETNKHDSYASFFDTSDEDDAIKDSSGQEGKPEPLPLSLQRQKENSEDYVLQSAIEHFFSGFPACIISVSHLAEDNVQYGVTSLTQAQGWTTINKEEIPRLFREWIADQTINYAMFLAASSSSTTTASSGVPHLWLIVTATQAMVVHTISLETWFKVIKTESFSLAAIPKPSTQ
ncbi:hypothetical protein BD289DRAFT_153406 [Coniella lustricola]|uniref:Uncharacterized protein n=1 Tax=Coniella lustricola TaxID=2025994 RepID=A0A2T3AMB3_9PEZI|nr:hypothetical protein BD289DRAFT_153406 [Coniella lustricola]